MLYGCNVADNKEGEDFVSRLAQLTQADIAASDDITGYDGDWMLEYATGVVDTNAAESIQTSLIEADYQWGLEYFYGSSDLDDHLIGTSENDRLYGYAGNNILEGGGGRDVIFGSYDDDTILGGDGNDSLYGGNGSDTIRGGEGDDNLYSGSNGGYGGYDGNEWIEGIDRLYGESGSDYITIETGGNFFIDGGAGADTVAFENYQMEDYIITITSDFSATVTTVQENMTGTLMNVEKLVFNDSSFSLVNSPVTGGIYLEVNGSLIQNEEVIQGTTIIVNSDELSDSDGFGGFNYQWFRSGEQIYGATSSSYVTKSADIGFSISVVVNYIDGNGYNESVTSAETVPVLEVSGPDTGLLITGFADNDWTEQANGTFTAMGNTTIGLKSGNQAMFSATGGGLCTRYREPNDQRHFQVNH